MNTPPPRGHGAHRLTIALLAATVLGACTSDLSPPLIDCDPGRFPCSAETPLGRVVLELQPRPLPTMAPISVALAATAPLDEVVLELEGRDMDMGPNRVRLAPQTALRWSGTATIPLCLNGRMPWRAVVTLRQGGRSARLAFGFDAG